MAVLRYCLRDRRSADKYVTLLVVRTRVTETRAVTVTSGGVVYEMTPRDPVVTLSGQ